MRDTYTCTDARCPACGHQLDGACDPIGDARPKPDDISVCIECASVLAYNADLTLRIASDDDLRALPPELLVRLALFRATVNHIRGPHGRH